MGHRCLGGSKASHLLTISHARLMKGFAPKNFFCTATMECLKPLKSLA